MQILHVAAVTSVTHRQTGSKTTAPNVCRQNWTKAVAGKGCVWSAIPSSSLGSCGHGWSSSKSRSSPSRKPKPWTPTTVTLKLSSTHLTRSVCTLCWFTFETTDILQWIAWTMKLPNLHIFFIFMFNPHLNLFQAPKQTLTCILDCMAHMLAIPEEVENAFLDRTIRAFTWVRQSIHPIIWNYFLVIGFVSTTCLLLNRWKITQRIEAKCTSPWLQPYGVYLRTWDIWPLKQMRRHHLPALKHRYYQSCILPVPPCGGMREERMLLCLVTKLFNM